MISASTLWPTFFASLFVAGISDIQSTYQYGKFGEKKYIRKEKVLFLILLIMMAVFVGLRKWCNDTGTYREVYDYLIPSSGDIFAGIDWSLGENPGYILLNILFKRLGATSQTFFMGMSFLTNGIYLWFIRKYSPNFWLSFFLFWTMGIYTFTAAAIKQTTAVAISLLGIDQLLNKKKVWFVILIFLAATIHPYALMFLIAPLLMYAPWSKKTYYVLGISVFAGVALQQLLGVIISITSMMGETYDQSTFSGEGVNVFRLLVVWAPVLLSFLSRKHMKMNREKDYNLFMNFSMLNAEIMFMALFGTANYFARLANYFLIFQAISIPWMLRYFDKQSKYLLMMVIILCYMMYFVFANVILTPFDSYFAKMTLVEYFQNYI